MDNHSVGELRKVSDLIATEEVRTCFLCAAEGVPLYSHLIDRYQGCPGEWNYRTCPQCGSVWLSPRPTADHIGRFYEGSYFTHLSNGSHSKAAIHSFRQKLRRSFLATVPGYERFADNWAWLQIGRFLAALPGQRDRALLRFMCLVGRSRGMLLDIGCGSGEMLLEMREAGWQVQGVETDRAAAAVARSQGVPVSVGTLEQATFHDEQFDAITLHHVIEHVHDPIAVLTECRRILKPGGRIVVITPNAESRGHRLFGRDWFALETPRHIHIFTGRAMRVCCERAGLNIVQLRTSSRLAPFIWGASMAYRRGSGSPTEEGDRPGIRGLWFLLREQWELRHRPSIGEEVLVIASRPGSLSEPQIRYP